MKSLSIALGVFTGILPIWGFQMLTAIGLSFVFRLNKILAIIGNNISFPPLIPFIIFASLKIGSFWMGDHAQSIVFDSSLSLEKIQGSLFQYAVGAVTLATLAGGVSGVLTYLFLKLFHKLRS